MQNITTTQKDYLSFGEKVGVTITGETIDGDPILLKVSSDPAANVELDDIKENSFSIERNWAHGSVLEIGCADTSELTFELDNHDGRWSDLRWEGSRLTVVLDIDGAPLQAGIFTVDEPPRKLTTMQIRALDDMARFNRPYSAGIAYPASLKQILIDACSQCNVTLHTISFDNDDYVVSQPPEGDDITFHHVVAWVAELAGCNAWIDHLARLQLTWYGDSQPAGTVEIGPDDRWSYELSEADTEITGIVYRAPAEGEVEEIDYLVGTDEYALIIEDNPLLQGGFEAVLSTIYDKIGGFAYRPLKFETIGYPHLWPGDKLTKIIDAEGSETASIITNHLFKLNGKSTIEARGKTETVRGYATGAPFTPRQKRVLRSVARVEAARHTSDMEQAALALNELMVNSLGFYSTTRTLPTGAKITYTHDKPLLEESEVIWTRTELGFAWTDEGWNGGNPVWQYGVTADGSMIARVLDVIGIRAEWIYLGPASTFAEGYDPSTKETPAGAQGKADAAEEAAIDYADKNVTHKVEIFSTGGLVFKNNVISTTLIARVYKGKNDVTDLVDSNFFRWTRISDDPTGDDLWNAQHYSGRKQITVTSADVYVRATFNCQILDYMEEESA